MTTTESNGKRILVVDDHPVVRKGLLALINEEADLQVCGEAEDAVEALRQVDALQPDLVIIDISLKKGHGIELVKQIKARNQQVRMLVSSMHDESVFAERALRAGAQGYIGKQEVPEKIIDAIRQVLQGKIYLSPTMTERILHRAAHPDEVVGRSPSECLSDRELAVFELIGQGFTTRVIAEKLHISIKTVETYREHIKTKLNLANTAELSRHAVQWVLENS